MKITNNTSFNFTPAEVINAEQRICSILAELCIRNDNNFCGSGLGGNNLQFLILSQMYHCLSETSNTIYYDNNILIWNIRWLLKASRKEVRQELNKLVCNIDEKYKYMALAMNEVINSNSMLETIQEYKDEFPKLVSALNGNKYTYNPDLTNFEHLIIACVVCQELSRRLDKKDDSFIDKAANILKDYSTEIQLLSLRKHIGIGRIIEHRLDEDLHFVHILTNVTKVDEFPIQ